MKMEDTGVKINDRPRKLAARVIREVEENGGFKLKCGCFIAMKASDLRRLMEVISPETVIELKSKLTDDHSHQNLENN